MKYYQLVLFYLVVFKILLFYFVSSTATSFKSADINHFLDHVNSGVKIPDYGGLKIHHPCM